MLTIDGSFGEGGGQVLRSSLGLSLLTGRPFRIENIRAGRKKPGLLHQHLAAVKAAAEVGCAEVEGARLRSRKLTFRPGAVVAGVRSFAVGTAGSATLVLQTVLPALLVADGPSTLHIEGGTHNPMAPPFDFVERTLLPLLRAMGPGLTARIDRRGFYPRGGGRFTVQIEPVARLAPLTLIERGEDVGRRVRAIVSGLPDHVARREIEVCRRELAVPERDCETVEERGHGPANVLIVSAEFEHVVETFTAFGEKGLPAEKVAARCCEEARRWLDADVPVGEHLADQLLLPLAIADGRSTFRTQPPSSHTKTNVEIIKQFLDVRIELEGDSDGTWRIEVGG